MYLPCANGQTEDIYLCTTPLQNLHSYSGELQLCVALPDVRVHQQYTPQAYSEKTFLPSSVVKPLFLVPTTTHQTGQNWLEIFMKHFPNTQCEPK